MNYLTNEEINNLTFKDRHEYMIHAMSFGMATAVNRIHAICLNSKHIVDDVLELQTAITKTLSDPKESISNKYIARGALEYVKNALLDAGI